MSFSAELSGFFSFLKKNGPAPVGLLEAFFRQNPILKVSVAHASGGGSLEYVAFVGDAKIESSDEGLWLVPWENFIRTLGFVTCALRITYEETGETFEYFYAKGNNIRKYKFLISQETIEETILLNNLYWTM